MANLVGRHFSLRNNLQKEPIRFDGVGRAVALSRQAVTPLKEARLLRG